MEHPRFLTLTLHFEDGTHLDIAAARQETYVQTGALPTVQPASLAVDTRNGAISARTRFIFC